MFEYHFFLNFPRTIAAEDFLTLLLFGFSNLIFFLKEFFELLKLIAKGLFGIGTVS